MTDKSNNAPDPTKKMSFLTYDQIVKNKTVGLAGLGDLVEKITTSLHIPTCDSCKKRKEYLNSLLPFGSKRPSE